MIHLAVSIVVWGFDLLSTLLFIATLIHLVFLLPLPRWFFVRWADAATGRFIERLSSRWLAFRIGPWDAARLAPVLALGLSLFAVKVLSPALFQLASFL